jgi:peroxiredoxin
MLRAFLVVLLGAVLAVGASAEEQKSRFNEKVHVGQQAPEFKDLEGVDGKRHSLDDYKDADVLVLAFVCNQCPVAQAYEERFKNLVTRYRDRKLAFVAINPCGGEVESLEKMQQRAQERAFNFDYLADKRQTVARSYGATATPHLFVLDKERRIAYMGAFDNSMDPSKVRHHYLEGAVKSLLNGERPEVAETLQFGCAIDYN